MTESKVCELPGCGEVYHRDPEKETAKVWAKRRFCCTAHARSNNFRKWREACDGGKKHNKPKRSLPT